MKIQKITVQNFKAVSDQEMEFNGCSAIVTAGNNKGKTSILRGLTDRFRSEKPDIIVKQGEDKGSFNMELTDGSVIEWKFTDKSESFSLTTKEGIKQTTGVLSGIGERYFGKKFDIDKFLSSGPKSQIKELQELVGLDFDEIDQRYKTAYEERTEANREVKRLRAINVSEPEKVDKPDVSAIKEALRLARDQNEERRKAELKVNELHGIVKSVYSLITGTDLAACFNDEMSKKMINSIVVPELINVEELESEADKANEKLRKFDSYERDIKVYNDWIKSGKESKKVADNADAMVSNIENEKKAIISGANMPEDFEITEDGILYKGLPLTDAQISSSGKYIAALKLGAMVLGEVKSLHFDASFLDKNSLSEIQVWANENDLQLLIERPDFEGGEIKYEIVK